jgi:hypothetical protein
MFTDNTFIPLAQIFVRPEFLPHGEHKTCYILTRNAQLSLQPHLIPHKGPCTIYETASAASDCTSERALSQL